MGKKQQDFCLEIPKLKLGEQTFSFDLNNDFWDLFQGGLITHGQVSYQVTVVKFANQLDVSFKADGKVELACDRCTQPFETAIHSVNRVIYSYAPPISGQEQTDFVSINRNQVFLDISQEMYDFVCISLPNKRIPTDCPGERCPAEVLKILGINQPETTQDSETIDPRWAELTKLKSTLK